MLIAWQDFNSLSRYYISHRLMASSPIRSITIGYLSACAHSYSLRIDQTPMKPILFSLPVFALLAALAWPESESPRSEAASGTVPVLVELFTSEGCSSCPPADALLARLDEQQPLGKIEIIGIEEHVDYWDDLGWRDPFSSHDWTERQYVYASKLGNRNPYTPQMIVDGQSEFLGSQALKAREAILKSASQPRISVTLAQKKLENSGARAFDIELGLPASGFQLSKLEVWLAITETDLHSSVKAGENSGRELQHAPVLRSLKKVGQVDTTSEKPFRGLFEVALHKEWKWEHLRAVAFVQDKTTGKILGAAQVPLGP